MFAVWPAGNAGGEASHLDPVGGVITSAQRREGKTGSQDRRLVGGRTRLQLRVVKGFGMGIKGSLGVLRQKEERKGFEPSCLTLPLYEVPHLT